MKRSDASDIRIADFNPIQSQTRNSTMKIGFKFEIDVSHRLSIDPFLFLIRMQDVYREPSGATSLPLLDARKRSHNYFKSFFIPTKSYECYFKKNIYYYICRWTAGLVMKTWNPFRYQSKINENGPTVGHPTGIYHIRYIRCNIIRAMDFDRRFNL